MGDYNKGYRTLTVDLKTYELLEELCSIERRKKIDRYRQRSINSLDNVKGLCDDYLF